MKPTTYALINENIPFQEVRVTHNGTSMGIMSLSQALAEAEKYGLDLLVISENASPPVCEILDYAKYQYNQKLKHKNVMKKARESKIDIKELHFSPNISLHDIGVKAKHAKKFIENGDKVKLSVDFKGREIVHISRGRELMQTVYNEIAKLTSVSIEKPESVSGKSIQMILTAKKEGK